MNAGHDLRDRLDSLRHRERKFFGDRSKFLQHFGREDAGTGDWNEVVAHKPENRLDRLQGWPVLSTPRLDRDPSYARPLFDIIIRPIKPMHLREDELDVWPDPLRDGD